MQPSSHIGQYKIIELLGKGGMGAVWLGEHTLLGRRAAIKTLLPSLSGNTEIVERFFNEARATAAISDPGVVQIYDFGYHVDGTAYIVMELLEGEALCDRMDRIGPLPLQHALRIVREITGALAAAHEIGIVHRDIKPENIYLVADDAMPGGERAKLLDFGICKFTDDDDARKTQVGTMIGTPVYMSPEQCRGSRQVDERSDIYALGCVLFHMLTDRTPFEGTSSGEYVAAHLTDEPPAPSSRIAGLTAEVDALVLRCMAKHPGDRFQTVRELRAEIDRLLGESTPTSELAPGPRGLKLEAGFRSKFDANMERFTPNGARVTAYERPNAGLYVTRTPITVPSNAAGWKSVKRAVAGLGILGLAVAIGLVGRELASDSDLPNDVVADLRPLEESTPPTVAAATPAEPGPGTVAPAPSEMGPGTISPAPAETVRHIDYTVGDELATIGAAAMRSSLTKAFIAPVEEEAAAPEAETEAAPPPKEEPPKVAKPTVDRRAKDRRAQELREAENAIRAAAARRARERAAREAREQEEDQAPRVQPRVETAPSEDLYDTR